MSATSSYWIEITRQTQRAIDLLDITLSILYEQSEENDDHLARVIEHIGKVRIKLQSASDPNDKEFSATIHSCIEMLDSAIQLAEQGPELSPRQAQCIQSIPQIQAILYPIARDNRINVNPSLSCPDRLKIYNNSEQKRLDGRERRKHTRVPLETTVDFEGLSNFYTGFIEDVSCGGLYVSTYNLQPLGTHIQLTFRLPNGHIVKAPGEVRWLRDPRDPNDESSPGMGIMFEELKREDKEQIEAYIRERSPIFYEDDFAT